MTLTNIKAALALMLAVSMQGCKSSSISTESVVTNTVSRDTVVVHYNNFDSVYVADQYTELYRPAQFVYDTIFKTYTRVDTIYRNRATSNNRLRIVHDSVYVNKVDTVPVVQKVQVVQKVRYIPRWCYWFSGIGILTILLLLLYIFIKIKPLF